MSPGLAVSVEHPDYCPALLPYFITYFTTYYLTYYRVHRTCILTTTYVSYTALGILDVEV